MSWYHWVLLVVGLIGAFAAGKALAGKKHSPRQETSPAKARPATPSPKQPDTTGEAPDAWEGAYWDVLVSNPTDAKLQFVYTDGKGQTTKREVWLRSFEPTNPTGLVIGYCQMRRALRTFRLDRMRDVVDIETGELIDNPQRWLLDRHFKSPAGIAEVLANKYLDQLRVLFYVAKADGQMLQKEVQVIAEFCAAITNDEQVSVGTVKAALKMLDQPTVSGFRSAFKRQISLSLQNGEALLSAAQKIVATQKTIHEDEAKAIAWMAQTVKAATPISQSTS